MTQAANKVEWCLRKAQKEGTEHRGLVRIQPNLKEAQAHLRKAGHYLDATFYLKEGAFSDICASTLFYVMYQSLLAIGLKFGYESRNQECTFAVIASLIDDKRITLERNVLEKVSTLNLMEAREAPDTAISLREEYQYSTKVSLENKEYQELLQLAKSILDQTKEILVR